MSDLLRKLDEAVGDLIAADGGVPVNWLVAVEVADVDDPSVWRLRVLAPLQQSVFATVGLGEAVGMYATEPLQLDGGDD